MSRKPAKTPRRSKKSRNWLLVALTVLAIPVTAAVSVLLVAVLALLLANDRLPPLDAMIDYRPRIPLRVYTADGILIGEFGEERRTFVRIEDVPQNMKDAVLAAEDSRFFEHPGVDLVGVGRAALANLLAGGTEQGASTLTMQLAREFFLSPERTYTRKIIEILLAFRIEESLSKEQILELYLNQIFLGKRAYGFAAASQTYFGKPLAKISAAEAAMLAGLPKAPSRYNPLVNPNRATERQRWILRRMYEAGFLDEAEYKAALEEKLQFAQAETGYELEAPYVAELARMLAWELYREQTYVSGLQIYTTILTEDQKAANAALRKGIFEYDRRHGYRGPERFVEIAADEARAADQIDAAITEAVDIEDLFAAVVLEASPKAVVVTRGRGGETITIPQKNLRFVARALTDKAPAAQKLRRGAVVRIAQNAKKEWEITQLPEVQAALVSAVTRDGAIRALVGGFDFSRNKFNRVTQAWRQPGSAFKPFVYSAALEKGLMTSTIINDAPVTIDPERTGGQLWDPKNYDSRYDGPLSMRNALARSKNMVSIRIIDEIGPQYAQDYITRFGFDAARHPAFLTMALGAGSVTPLQMVGGISVFANGGYRVQPYLIERITDSAGRVLAKAHPPQAGDESQRAIDARNAFLMDSMLRGVVRSGTATRARNALKRSDIGGKTGTTNDSHDAWFVGYQKSLAAVAWVGFDQPRKLGDRETGGGLALPIWIDYMASALRGVPEQPSEPPPGVVQVAGEYYYSEMQPGQGIASIGVAEGGLASGENVDRVRDQVF
ncbi:MAG TPA: penicillin-binding protein 1A [Burkholderiaceae bacterium]|nr:penicillin-binding protein 1A [Burkholderiaceae bacterium]